VVAGPSGRIPEALEAWRAGPGYLPPSDLIVLAVRDDALSAVAEAVAPWLDGTPIVCHLSGMTDLGVLDPLTDIGCAAGSFHPIQSLPDPDTGAGLLTGSYVAITADDAPYGELADWAQSLGMHPVRLAEHNKPAHHSAASAASNFVVAALAVTAELAAGSGVPLDAYARLTRTSVENAYGLGPLAALTGPVVRGDAQTVARQLEAAAAISSELGASYAALVEATARAAGRWPEFGDLVAEVRS